MLVIFVFKLVIVISVPMLSTSIVRIFVRNNVIAEMTSVEELSDALLILDEADDVSELAIMLVLDLTALSLFLA